LSNLLPDRIFVLRKNKIKIGKIILYLLSRAGRHFNGRGGYTIEFTWERVTQKGAVHCAGGIVNTTCKG